MCATAPLCRKRVEDLSYFSRYNLLRLNCGQFLRAVPPRALSSHLPRYVKT